MTSMNWINDLDHPTCILTILTIPIVLIALFYLIYERFQKKLPTLILLSLLALLVFNGRYTMDQYFSYDPVKHYFATGRVVRQGVWYETGKYSHGGYLGCLQPCNQMPGQTLLFELSRDTFDQSHEYQVEYSSRSRGDKDGLSVHLILNLYDLTARKTLYFEDTTYHGYRVALLLANTLALLMVGFLGLKISNEALEPVDGQKDSEDEPVEDRFKLQSLNLNDRDK